MGKKAGKPVETLLPWSLVAGKHNLQTSKFGKCKFLYKSIVYIFYISKILQAMNLGPHQKCFQLDPAAPKAGADLLTAAASQRRKPFIP